MHFFAGVCLCQARTTHHEDVIRGVSVSGGHLGCISLLFMLLEDAMPQPRSSTRPPHLAMAAGGMMLLVSMNPLALINYFLAHASKRSHEQAKTGSAASSVSGAAR